MGNRPAMNGIRIISGLCFRIKKQRIHSRKRQ